MQHEPKGMKSGEEIDTAVKGIMTNIGLCMPADWYEDNNTCVTIRANAVHCLPTALLSHGYEISPEWYDVVKAAKKRDQELCALVLNNVWNACKSAITDAVMRGMGQDGLNTKNFQFTNGRKTKSPKRRAIGYDCRR